MGLGAETWVTVVEANTYFLHKWGAGAWAALSTSDKESLLISAYRWIKSLNSLTISIVTDNLKNAQYETAWYIYKFWTEHEKRSALIASGVKEFEVSEFSETLGAAQFPASIFELLKSYVTKGTAQIVKVYRDLD